jgi:hypothetical protein
MSGRQRWSTIRTKSHNAPLMLLPREIRIEGYTADELLAALDEETEAVLFSGYPLVFRAGSASILFGACHGGR